ncbi:RAD55 family ATPase [Natrarchaeobaculum sulfurireducens]|uniref:HTR-like protein n=1 Tax=Natrarchaeobaculum sulfurireducens TaxID=2044521 RepID=A0A346PRR8_9EURY|nr:HTR-like protein [Natrarchaeobaculum sulfurireducens]AXR77804.1 RecA-superfamily ATPase implicated in signal transduction [Natrarchaeobaculum sulfurireducens]AXR82213.1 HTR-like protein [Natrarchaeobaculum sulfurireducens]
MERMPLGVSRLDGMVGGGAPAGSVVLLAGESGAGAREFCYTSAVMNGLAATDHELFDLHYGELESEAVLPDRIHYLSFTDERRAVTNEMSIVMDGELVRGGMADVEFVELADEYFRLTPVPSEWYVDGPTTIADLDTNASRSNVLEALASYLNEHAAGNLVVVDSLTDLVAVADDRLEWSDLTVLLKGLARASHRWGGVILLLVNSEVLSPTQLGRLKEATDGTFRFEWESGGSERARTLVVEQFRGVLSRLEDENIVQFETEIHDSGFDISNVRKIR